MSAANGADRGEPDLPAARDRPLSRRRRRLRRTVAILTTIALLAGAGGAIAWWLNRPSVRRPGEDLPEITRNLARDLPAGAPAPHLTDVTAASGLDGFRTFAGPRSSQIPEDMGAGAAWGDFDGDGDDDLFLVSAGGAIAADPSTWAPCALYENRGDGTFRPVDDFEDLRIVGMGAAWGDADGDGRLDLVVTGYGTLLLFLNRDGRLVRDASFPSPPGYWAGASWGDYDGDRDLDLYVCGYVRYVERDADRALASRQFGTMVPYTLNPSSYEPERNLLYRNDGAEGFVEVAGERGVANTEGRSLGALWHDFDLDGRLDLYVANDVSDNVFFHNTGLGFEDVSHAAWVADYRGAMGLAQGDYDRDGDDDILVTHWVAQENALYDSLLVDLANLPNDGNAAPVEGLRFVDSASAKGIGQLSIQRIGWGAEFADFDGDGWLDLAIANGSTFETAEAPKALRPQRSFLFWSRAGSYFHDLAEHCPAMVEPRVSRGLAVSDYDGDGDQDLLIVDLDGGVRLLRNDMQTGNWMRIRLRSRDAQSAPSGFGDGATVAAHVGDAVLRRAVGGASYLSQSSRTLHLGLGDARQVDRLEIRWNGAATEVHRDLAANTLWEIIEGDPNPRRVEPAPVPRDEKERVRAFWSAQRAAMRAIKVDGDHAAAIPLFREALALDPDHEDSRYYLANSLAAVGETEAAVRELEALSRLDPLSHRTFKRLGVLRAMQATSREDLEKSMIPLERALEINKEAIGTLLAMSEVALMLGEDDSAEQRLEWVSRTNPRAVSAFFFRGYLAWKRGDVDEARRLLEQAREALGPEWVPEGTTSEGDVEREMHAEESPLAHLWRGWDGDTEPDHAFEALAAYLEHFFGKSSESG